MPVNLERDRNLIEERFANKLWKHGWKKYKTAFFKGSYVLEFDDIGFFFWIDDLRVAGMAWDYLTGHMPEKKITFKTGKILYID